MSLKAYIRTAAAATPALTALLGTNPFRWYDDTLLKGSSMPAVAAKRISDSATYTMTGRNAVGQARFQFTVWANTAPDADAVEGAIVCFIDRFNAMGVANLQGNPNYIVNRTDRIYPETNPPMYQRILDVKIFSNELVTN